MFHGEAMKVIKFVVTLIATKIGKEFFTNPTVHHGQHFLVRHKSKRITGGRSVRFLRLWRRREVNEVADGALVRGTDFEGVRLPVEGQVF